jgi:aryl carrier-like protein
VLELWRRLLGRDDVGPDDNFFTCGGDSLLAARVIGHIKKTTGKGISLRTLFTAPTPVAFASALESAGVTRLRPAEAG